MKQKLYRFAVAAFLYFAFTGFAEYFFVFPPQAISLSAFLPPVLGLMWGPVAAFGAAFGDVLANWPVFRFREIVAVFFAAYLPYKMWHSIATGGEEPVFAFRTKNLIKFVAITFATVVLLSVFIGFTADEREIAEIFDGFNLQVKYPAEYAGILFLNNFDVAIFFGMPIFFILVSYGYNFYLPSAENVARKSETIYNMNRLALMLLYVFFLVLFVVLDVSGIIYDLDKMDTWLQFNGEILTMMNVTLFALFYMLLKYRHSIMTNLMLLEMATIFVAAFMLGSVSFAAISGIIDEHVDNDLQKMSVIYRERLSHTFNDTRMAVSDMSRLAVNELESYERLKNDAGYRKNYLDTMERNFTVITENSAGSIGFYLQFSPDIADEGFLCTRNPQKWGTKLPNFVRQDDDRKKNRYHIPQERHLAKLSEPYLNENTGHYMISYVVPLQKDDKFIGIVGIDIDFDYIIHEIRRMSVYEHGYVCLLDKNGDILYANQQESETGIDKKGFYETETYLSNGIWLKIAAFAHDIYADRNNMLIHFVVVMLFVVIAVSFFSIWLAERGIQPLRLIIGAAKKIADGDLDVKLSYTAKNELGTLVDSIKEMVAKLDVYVYHDKLTGLLNTAAYVRRVDELEKRRKEEKTEYAIAVFDANFLKRINDNYGHEAGNELIKRAAVLISRVFAKSRVYRVGGDEFVALLEGDDYGDRENLLQKFDSECERESFEADGREIKVSIARGIAVYNEAEEFSEVFRRADAEMYRHKAEIKAKSGAAVR